MGGGEGQGDGGRRQLGGVRGQEGGEGGGKKQLCGGQGRGGLRRRRAVRGK